MNFFALSEEQYLTRKGYTVLGDLGEGTYSTVKQALWRRTEGGCDVKVALKIIDKKTARGDFLEKFLPREIEVMKKIKHPNLVRLYELFQISSKLYFTLEWAGHGDLLQYIRIRGPIKPQDCHRFFTEITAGVDYLHGMGIVHRDLKCENVLLSKKNAIKIADFGFAREISEYETSTTYCGSAAYAAPELLQGKPYPGFVADVWSMGVILYVMNCATMPFRDNNIKLLLKDQYSPLHIPKNQAHRFQGDIKDLLSGILCYEKEKRYGLAQVKAHTWFIAAPGSP